MASQKVEVFANGGKFCSCGGLMVGSSDGYLMSDPPKLKIECRFCGSQDTILAPYNVDIQFKHVEG